MHDLGSAGQTGKGSKVALSPMAQVLTWGGVLLLVAGGLLAYPYVNSRLVTLPPIPTPTPGNQVFAASATLLPSLADRRTLAEEPGFSTPTVTSAAIASALTPNPTHTHTPTLTPAPPTRIVIPAIGVDAPVVPVSWQTVEVGGQTQAAWEVLDMYAAGWHETSVPLGVAGNTVLNGHNTTNGEVFRNLYTLEAGDAIIVYSGDTPYTYAVTEVLILPEAGQPLEVRIKNARYILPTDDERLTLVTCHPYGSLQYRLIVIAHPMATTEDREK